MTSTSTALEEIYAAARPLIEQALDLTVQFAALRDLATAKGLDWSQIKALAKAHIQDERDETGDGKRVNRIVEKAEFASAYAEMLGFGNMNEKNYSALAGATLELRSVQGKADGGVMPLPSSADQSHAVSVAPVPETEQGAGDLPAEPPAPASLDDLELPDFLNRRSREAALQHFGG